jgi:hypothetical protein
LVWPEKFLQPTVVDAIAISFVLPPRKVVTLCKGFSPFHCTGLLLLRMPVFGLRALSGGVKMSIVILTDMIYLLFSTTRVRRQRQIQRKQCQHVKDKIGE